MLVRNKFWFFMPGQITMQKIQHNNFSLYIKRDNHHVELLKFRTID